jgi:hypothetical protein
VGTVDGGEAVPPSLRLRRWHKKDFNVRNEDIVE